MLGSATLELRGVSKSFGVTEVVRDVSLRVENGELLTLLGASGCGKTTILRIMAGFERPNRGEVLISGQDVTKLPPYRRKIGMVFQSLALFPHLDVNANVAFGLSVQKASSIDRKKKVDTVLQMVGLEGLGPRSINQLSGGQRQRVALARSLVTQPDVLLLDEPFSALDLKLRRQMQSELKAIQKSTGATFVFVTHDQDEALSLSDRIAVIRDGKIEQLDNAKDIYLKPASTFVGMALGEVNVFPVRKVGSSYRVETLSVELPICSSVNCDSAFAIVRPEHVLVRPAGPVDIRARASIIERNFAGAMTSYVLKCGGLNLMARNPFVVSRDLPNPGEDVEIGWQSENCTIVPS